MAIQTFGQTGNGGSSSTSSADANLANRSTESNSSPASSGTLVSVNARLWLSATGSSLAHAALWDGTTGVPLAVSDEQTITNTTETELVFTFSGLNAIALVSGVGYTYGVMWKDPGTPSITWSRQATSSTSFKNNVAYVTGSAQNPIGSGTVSGPVDMYVKYDDAGGAVSASVAQTDATITFTGGTQSIATVQDTAVAQSAATLTFTGGTQAVAAHISTSVTQSAATLTFTGGTQSIASVQDVSIVQSAATLTLTGGTQSIATVNIVSVSQSAATLTLTGGTQSIATVNDVALTQSHATLTFTGGTQAIVTIQVASISQSATTITFTGGTQSVRSNTPSIKKEYLLFGFKGGRIKARVFR